jgi:hypothetical protein
MRYLAPLLVVALLALAGCGDSSDGTTTAPAGGAIDQVDEVRAAWEENPDCEHPKGASRWGCSVGDYTCQGVVTERGWTISCAKPGQSIAFRVRPE